MNAITNPATPLLFTLLQRGDAISIEYGRLVVKPVSCLPVPEQWLDENGIHLVTEILQETGQDGLVYLGYTTGKYGKKLAGGVTLQFKHLLTGIEAYAIFNADLTRSRNTKNGKAGDPLPDGQFHLAKGSGLCKLWLETGQQPPKRHSTYYEYMGNLKQFVFQPQSGRPGSKRLVSSLLKPLHIGSAEIGRLFDLTDKPPTSHRQLTDKSHRQGNAERP